MKRLLWGSALVSLACHVEPTVVQPTVVVTLFPTEMTGTTAVLAGTVNPHGIDNHAWFEWSREPSLSEPAVTPARTIEPGSADVALSSQLTGLVPDDTYYFRAVASSIRGSVNGSTLSFRTPLPPSTYTAQYQLVGNSSNVVAGGVWPNGNATLAWFAYGTDSTFTVFSETPKRSIGSGPERVDVTETLPGLQRYTTYYLRVMGSNVGGTTAGNIAWFTTGAPPDVGPSGFYPTPSCDAANLYSYVTPNGADTQGWFEYSTSSSMSDYVATPAQSLGTGATRPVSLRITLPMASTFYFRAAASNWLGTVRDVVEVASRDACPTP